ncbi:UDP-glucosyltransferase 2-like, partial [Polistes fuscatus]|uniref:UDP-glucosyltransferase 2-like n=1 Tax=Polistes fuscatus TaxID=30207 RepID=UPI001CA9EB28
MASLIATTVTFLLIHNIGFTSSARILAIMPTPSYSHQIVYHSIFRNLNLRGHHITLVTPNLLPDKNLKNFTQIDISHSYKLIKTLNFLETRHEYSWLEIIGLLLFELSEKICILIFEHPDFKKIYAPDSNEKFDLVMVEAIWTPAILAFGHRFKAPLIGVFPSGLTQMSHFFMGNPMIPSHPSSYELNIEKYLGNIPPIRELEKNISILFMDQQEEISFTRPNVANIINFSGLHIANNVTNKPLPKGLKEFIDNGSNGFIYVSLGTNIHPSMFPKKLLDIFFNVFSNLPVKVVWKFNGNILKIPENIYIAAWFPQQTILAHPNLKLFVYQGGLQSTEEAIHFGVPLVGIPVIADQDMNVIKMESLGTCRSVDILQITRESLNEAIMDILNNKSYKENMLKLKNLIKDKPYNSTEKVIWWTEYVIRHKGAPHLRSSIVDEPWYQRYNTDVIAFLSVTLFIIALLYLYV